MQPLDQETFLGIIRHTPLVSIDLIVTNTQQRVLLGKRRNAPARDYWFVPGGRIFKNETLCDAFARISQAELGHAYNMNQATALGSYEHFYAENFAAAPDISTHYVVLAYQLTSIDLASQTLPTTQHHDYRWFEIGEILDNPAVHDYSRAYFKRDGLHRITSPST